MPRWCPKSSKLGVLPNHTHDPMKSAPLGAIVKNSIECKSGDVACDDFFQNPEQQSRKKHSKEKKFTRSIFFFVRSIEVLRQGEGDILGKMVDSKEMLG